MPHPAGPSTPQQQAGTSRGYFGIWLNRDCIGRVSLIVTPALSTIGYEISPAFRRRGLASEAVAAVLAALPGFGITALHAHCRSTNQPSRAVLTKSGFVLHTTRPWSPGATDDACQFMVYRWTAQSTVQPSMPC